MEKNPFSLFDFLGYFIPGAFALFLVYFLQNDQGLQYYFIRDNIDSLKTDIPLLYLTFFTILSYTLGHILSFLSTLTIENYTIWMFGYPFKNLLGIHQNKKYFERKMKDQLNIDWLVTFISVLLRSLLAIFLAPITFSSIFGHLLNLNNSVYEKKLKDPYPVILQKAVIDVFHKINQTIPIDFNNLDYNKLLIHHSYNVNIAHQPKLMNYVALYGFLRVISFILNILSLYLLLDIINLSFFKTNIKSHYNLGAEIMEFAVASFMTYAAYLGYLKFYRRYTEENLMILLLDN